jgi:alkanesulfonate monooxygenase SsuD/methylene tetrahydromethanopterin reductase-like flavin-dependent oxidoreductase (luciferase family)
MLGLLANGSEDNGLRLAAAEALGWYTHSWRRQEVYDALKSMKPDNPDIADEVYRSIRRLEDNAHTR